jgi:hypothetical protein
VAVVCGRRRERHPESSIYNTLCDLEWNTPVGEADACGGDALLRISALRDAGGYDETMIAGEEPEMCLRMRAAAWKVRRIDHEMTLHDARITRFAQWWKRAVRSGHAYADGRAKHGRSRRWCVRQVRSVIEWALLLPLVAIGLAWVTWGGSLLLLALYGVLARRVMRHRVELGDSPADARLYARYTVVGKFAQLQGMLHYWWNRLRGTKSTLIEYKGVAHGASAANLAEASKA